MLDDGTIPHLILTTRFRLLTMPLPDSVYYRFSETLFHPAAPRNAGRRRRIGVSQPSRTALVDKAALAAGLTT
jgi:hypothetical protein